MVSALLIGAAVSSAQPAPRTCQRGVSVAVDTSIEADEKRRPPVLQPITMSPPAYPAALRTQRIEGNVRADIYIDANGRVIEGATRIVSETHREFGDAVCAAVRGALFKPFMVNGVARSVVQRNTLFKFWLQ